MRPLVSIITSSTSDLPVMEKARKFLNGLKISFEVNTLSARRASATAEEFAKKVVNKGIKAIIATAGMVAALPGVIAANTTLPITGVPIKGMLDGLDAILSVVQIPPGVPVATVGVSISMNATTLAVETLALTNESIARKIKDHKAGLGAKVMKANVDLA